MPRRLEQWEHLLRELRAEFLLREEELELLHAIDVRLLEDELFLEETLPFITDGIKSLIQADHASILLRRGRVLEVAYSSDGLDVGQRISIPDSIAGKCLTERRDIFIEHLPDSPLREKYRPIVGYVGPPIQSLVEVPIDFRDEAVGVLCIESARSHAFRRVHTRVMRAIASQVAIALQHVQHFRSAALFADVDQMMIDPGESQQVIQAALQRVMAELHKLHRVRVSGAQILFLREPGYLEIVHSTAADKGLMVSIDESICGRAVRERRTVVVREVSNDPQYRRMLGSTIQSEIAVPITLGDDHMVIGVLNVESTEPDAFTGFNQIVLESFADKVRILLAFVKLRADVTDTLEARHASELLVAVGDQTSHLVHRLNNSVGALRIKVLQLQERLAQGALLSGSQEYLRETLSELLELADRTLEMPEQVTKFLSQGEGNAVDVNRCIISSLEEITPPVNINVDTKLHDNIPELPLYSFDIVVQNLIKNAIDAMPGGGRLEISTDLVSHPEALSGYVQLTVRDTGLGIPEDILPHIFELNFTTKRSKGNGLGLGLWWIRTFVLRSRGEISVDSKPGEGTTFTIKIPTEDINKNTAHSECAS
jgi:signal transduction histidine kinase